MKLAKYILIASLGMASLSACNDDSMDRFPIEKPSEETAFKTSLNFKTYAWGLYGIFTNKDIMLRGYNMTGANTSYWEGDRLANYVRNGRSLRSIANPYANHGINANNTSGYVFSYIRSVNVMLDNIDGSQMDDNEKAHWRSVGYFFRAYNYVELIMRYGDVPWIDHVLTEEEGRNDIPQRRPRAEVAELVLNDLLYASENINTGAFAKMDADGKNTINKHVVDALISRFGLWEGTWQKYHNVEDGNPELYLNASLKASETLMKAFPNVGNNYDASFNTEDLSTIPGTILYKEFVYDVIAHNTMQFLRSDASAMEATKQSVNMFLMQNGKPVHHPDNADTYNDKTMNDEFRNRDYRLYFNIIPPYKVAKGTSGTTWRYSTTEDYTEGGCFNNPNCRMDGSPESDREYIDLMEQISASTGKRLPVSNWAGNVLHLTPHFFGYEKGGMGTIGPMRCVSGYFCWKEYNTWDKTIAGSFQVGSADKPIFKIEEVLLNYAEAKYELGGFDQSIADKTINVLRPRVNVANMNVAEINENFDPDRDPSVEPVLWEIRRERFTELFGEGFGFYDIRRWKTAPWWINQKPLGVYMRRTDQGGMPDKYIFVDEYGNVNYEEGYMELEPTRPDELSDKGWDDTFYLYPIPAKQFILNSGLKQNPGWEKF